MWLLADVGGTNTRMASLATDGAISSVEVVSNDSAEGLAPIFSGYLDRQRKTHQFDAAAIAVAGPVAGDVVSLTNKDWSFGKETLRQQLGLGELTVVNDFVANALSLPTLDTSEWLGIGGGEACVNENMVAIGPGTGLGVSALVCAKDGSWIPVQGEGGHVTLAAASSRESQLIELARQRVGHVSAESFLSGSGLPLLYQTVAGASGVVVDSISPEQIAQQAAMGDDVARETMAHFFAMLGTVAGDLALTFMATGGVYISGGIIPRFVEDFAASAFRERFENKGRHSAIVQQIPTRLVTAEIPAFRGLATLVH